MVCTGAQSFKCNDDVPRLNIITTYSMIGMLVQLTANVFK